MDIKKLTADYEAWISARMPLLPDDLAAKHQAMTEDPFMFFRATFYAWVSAGRTSGRYWPRPPGA